MRKILALTIVCALCAGCVTVPWSTSPLKSQGKIEIVEKIDGSLFKMKIVDNGDGSFAQDFNYQGEGENPWIMSLGATADITSPAAIRSFDSLDLAIQQIPELLELFGPAPSSGQGKISWAAEIFGFLGNNPTWIPNLIGALL